MKAAPDKNTLEKVYAENCNSVRWSILSDIHFNF